MIYYKYQHDDVMIMRKFKLMSKIEYLELIKRFDQLNNRLDRIERDVDDRATEIRVCLSEIKSIILSE